MSAQWKTEIWVQPLRTSGWCSRRCGPWHHFGTVWTNTFQEIPEAVKQHTTCGLYTRMLLCTEEYENGNPVDHV